MRLDYEAAIDMIMGHARAACLSAGFPDSQIAYENIQHQSFSLTADYARPYIRHATNKRAGIGIGPKRRFEKTGMLWIKMFVRNGDGTTNHVPITQKMLDYFERLNSPISYVNIKAVEDGTQGSFYVTDFLAQFSYDTFN